MTKNLKGCHYKILICFPELFNDRDKDINLYEVLIASDQIGDFSALKKFSTRQLALILGHNPVLKGKCSTNQNSEFIFGAYIRLLNLLSLSFFNLFMRRIPSMESAM